MFKIVSSILLLAINQASLAGSGHQPGKISNITATTSGIMLMMDTGFPDNCAGTPYGWMLIKQEHTAITSLVLTAWASGKTSGTVYTTGRANGTGYCLVSQFDPHN